MLESRVSQRDEHHLDPMHRHVSLRPCEFPAAFETRQHHGDKACFTRSGESLRHKPRRALVQSIVSDADRLASLHVDNPARRVATGERCGIRSAHIHLLLVMFESLDQLGDQSSGETGSPLPARRTRRSWPGQPDFGS